MKTFRFISFISFVAMMAISSGNHIQAASEGKTNIVKDFFKFDSRSKRSIKLSELSQGCPSVDCIPAIDSPQYAPINEISFLHDDDVMMTVEHNGVRKSYPRKILQSHEIVNDYFNGSPVAMTYCPLCGTSIAFVPVINGERVEFGVSGVLHNSDLVMYDRKTKSLWGQITGKAIVGSQTGKRLKKIGVGMLTWKELKAELPDTLVLLPPSKQLGAYKEFHYQKYTESEKLMFPVSAKDARLAAKKFVYGIEVDGKFIAYESEYLKKRTPLVESFGKRTLMVTFANGEASAIDKKTNQEFDVLGGYWFAWFAFHPKTQLRH